MMTLEELEKRVSTLEDLEAIRDLHHEYVFRLNNRQWDDIVDCFVDDATANIGAHGLRRGKAEITALFKERIARMNTGKGRDAHMVAQPVISIEGDKAQGHWLMYIFITDPATGNARMTPGRHDCEYVKVNGKWKFKSVKYTRPWPIEPESLPKD
jgi:ketosteroid isomerase-like protein